MKATETYSLAFNAYGPPYPKFVHTLCRLHMRMINMIFRKNIFEMASSNAQLYIYRISKSPPNRYVLYLTEHVPRFASPKYAFLQTPLLPDDHTPRDEGQHE